MEMTLDLALKGTQEESFIKMVKLELQDIKKSFVKIGFRLYEANNLKYYEKLGYNSIEELAENEFELKRSSTYNLIAIAKHFCNGMFLDDNYKNYSYSQLIIMVKMLTYLSEPYRRCNENYTVAQFNEYYSYLKKGGVNSMTFYFEEQNLIEEEKQAQEPIKSICLSKEETNAEIPKEETNLKEKLVNYFNTFKTIFDPDNKGLGVRVLPTTLTNDVIDIFNETKQEKSKRLDCNDRVYLLYSEMEDGRTGLYTAYNKPDIEKSIKNYKKKGINFWVKEYEFIEEKTYNKGENK